MKGCVFELVICARKYLKVQEIDQNEVGSFSIRKIIFPLEQFRACAIWKRFSPRRLRRRVVHILGRSFWLREPGVSSYTDERDI